MVLIPNCLVPIPWSLTLDPHPPGARSTNFPGILADYF
jgi:hypothetical protein